MARVLAAGGHLVYSDFHPSWAQRGWSRTFRAADGVAARRVVQPARARRSPRGARARGPAGAHHPRAAIPKLVPIEAADELQDDGVGFAGYAVGRDGPAAEATPTWSRSPTCASYTPLPVRASPGLALVHCDPHVEGKPWPFAPRVILQGAAAAGRRLGPAASRSGAEVEYFLVNRDRDGALAPGRRQGRRRPALLRRPRRRPGCTTTSPRCPTAMNALGWGNYANDHEDGNGQFEQNFAYADALTTADRVITAPVPALGARRAARHDGHVHAQAVHRPHRHRPAPAPVAVARTATPLFPDAGDDGHAGSGLSPLGLRVPRRDRSTTRRAPAGA